MSNSSYIPVGRTSLVKRGEVNVQVQTEYASRPTPRVTTTISHSGQVLHKIERSLVKPVESNDEQHKTELEMRRQHDEIITIIERENRQGNSSIAQPAQPPPPLRPPVELLRDLPTVSHVFRVSNQGQLIDADFSKEFVKLLGPLTKNLMEVLSLFSMLPGSGGRREKGVVELKANRLYVASSGNECFFIVINKTRENHPYEKLIKQIVDPNPFA